MERACASLGGKLELFYCAFGEADVVAVMDLPDNLTASSVPSSLQRAANRHRDDGAVNSGGG